jgi:hypothetical protein
MLAIVIASRYLWAADYPRSKKNAQNGGACPQVVRPYSFMNGQTRRSPMEKTHDTILERENILVALQIGIIDMETAELLLDELCSERGEKEEASDNVG